LRMRVLQRLDQRNTFAVCVPVVTETLFGIGTLPRATQNRAEWKRLRLDFTCYIPDEGDAEAAADLQISLRQKGKQVKTIDAVIAIIALRYDLILLTTDRDFQAAPNLTQENWMQP